MYYRKHSILFYVHAFNIVNLKLNGKSNYRINTMTGIDNLILGTRILNLLILPF